MAEELAFDQRWRDRAAVEGDKRLAGAPRETVNRPSGDFLPGAGSAGDQDGSAGASDPADDLEDARHRLGAAHEVAQAAGLLQLGPQGLDFRLQAPSVGQPVEDDLELRGAQRLHEVVEGPGAQRFDRVVDRALSRDDDSLAIRVLLARGLQDFNAVAVGQMDIHDQDPRIKPLDGLEGLLGGTDRSRLAAQVPDRFLQSLAG